MKRIWFTLGLVLAVVLLGVTACDAVGTTPPPADSTAKAAAYSNQQTGIWVNGEGKVTAVPDIALITLGIESQANTVAEAQTKAREAMSKVISALTSRGVADKDIQTRSFSIQPVYQYLEKERRQQIIGYRVSNMVSAKIRKIDDAGNVIDAVALAGGDLARIQSIGFQVDNPKPYSVEARDKAMKDAIAKAEQMAKLAKVNLGKPIYISESGVYVPQPRYFDAKAMGAAAEATPPTPISPGEQEIQVNVQVVFAIQ